MPRIPTTQSSVQAQVPQIGTQQVSSVNIPNAVPGQFGEQKYAAQERLGVAATNAGMNIVNMIQSQQEKKQLVKMAQKENEFLIGMNQIDYGEGEVSKTDETGKSYLVPKGIKNRLGNQADKSTVDWKNETKKLGDTLLKDMPEGKYRENLKLKFLGHIVSKKENQIQHETTQLRKAAKETFDARNKLTIDSVGSDAKSLGETINRLSEYQVEEQAKFGYSNEVRVLETNKNVEEAVSNSTSQLLNATGELKTAKELLKSAKDYLLPKSYKDIEDDLTSEAKKIKELKDWKIKDEQTQSTFDLTQGLVDGTLTTKTVREYQRSGKIASDVASIFDIAARKKYTEMPQPNETGKSDYFVKLIDDNIGNKKEIMAIVKDATKAYGDGKLGVDQYAYFIGQASKKFDTQRKKYPKSELNQPSVDENAHYTAVKSLEEFTNTISGKNKGKYTDEAQRLFINGVNKGLSPENAKDVAIKSIALKTNSKISNLPKEGKVMIDKNGNKAMVYPDGTFKDLGGGGKPKEKGK